MNTIEPERRFRLAITIIGGVFALSLVSGFLLFKIKKQRIAAVNAAALDAANKTVAAISRGAERPHVRGAPTAPVVLEEFGDFQCQSCGDLSSTLEKLEQDYRGRLQMIFREFPLSMHPHALDAARAAEAAGLQNQFWEMHDLLYRERFKWPRIANLRQTFSDYAKSLGLDVERFIKEMDGELVRDRIGADQRRGKALMVDRTPTLFVNHRPVPMNALNPPGLHEIIEKALKDQTRSNNNRK